MDTATKEYRSLEYPAIYNSNYTKAGFLMSQGAISEVELIDNLENSAVTSMSIIEDDDGKFQICVTLAWKEGEQLLETQRKKPRTWASLDRLVRHINTKYRNPPEIRLLLRSRDKDELARKRTDCSDQEHSAGD